MINKTKDSVRYITISEEYQDQRIDNYLMTHLKGVPKSHVYRILRKGEVRVNKKRAKPSYRLNAGDFIRIPPIRMSEKPPVLTPNLSLLQDLKARILYEDADLLVINKPSGLPVHGGTEVSVALIEAMKNLYPKLPHLELAHRLDADTSGCLILAKKRSILKELHELLREGHIVKKYFALTKGHWKASELKVEVLLQKNFLAGGERIVRVNASEGKKSTTLFRVIQSYRDVDWVEAHLLTGRTHQIRVHCQYRQHPIAGDGKYGDKEFNKKMKVFGLKRLFLHASEVLFTLPSKEREVHVKAPLDADLESCLKALEHLI